MIKKQATLADVTDFKNWLTKRVDEGATTYDAHNQSNCLVCQYLKARGKTSVNFEGPDRMYVHNGGRHCVSLPLSIAKIAYGMTGSLGNRSSDSHLYTFAAALSRASKVIEQLQH